jgi:hypothetical protein
MKAGSYYFIEKEVFGEKRRQLIIKRSGRGGSDFGKAQVAQSRRPVKCRANQKAVIFQPSSPALQLVCTGARTLQGPSSNDVPLLALSCVPDEKEMG